MAVSVEIKRGKHSHPIPDGYKELFSELFRTAGFDGHFEVMMGRAIRGTSYSRGIKIVCVEAWCVRVKAQTTGNGTRRICDIYLRDEMKPYETRDRLAKALVAMKCEIEDNGSSEDVEIEDSPEELAVGNPTDLLVEPYLRLFEGGVSDTNGTSSHGLVIKPQPFDPDSPVPQAASVGDGSGQEPVAQASEAEEEWRARITQTFEDNKCLSILLYGIEERGISYASKVPSRVVSEVVRSQLTLHTAPDWVVPHIVRKLTDRGFLEGVVEQGRQRQTAYIVTLVGLELIAQEQGEVPYRLAKQRKVEEAPLPAKTASLAEQAKELRERAAKYEAAKAEYERLQLAEEKFNRAIAKVQEHLGRLASRKLELEQVVSEYADALREWNDFKEAMRSMLGE